MSDLLEHGTPQRRRPRWVPAVLALVLVGSGAAYVGTQPGSLLSSPPRPSATPTRSPAPPPATAGSLLPEWPEVPGACGNQVSVPVLSTTPLREPTGLRVLVGGHGLRRVDVDTGATRWVRGADVRRRQVTALARAAAETYAIGTRCSTNTSTGAVLAVSGAAVRAVARHADTVLAGAGTAWDYRYGTQPNRGLTLRSLGGSARTRLPRDFSPMAVTPRYFVGGFYGGLLPDDLPQVAVLDRSAPHRLRSLRRGVPLAVARESVVSYLGCLPGGRCVLDVTPISGGQRTRIELPRGGSPSSEGVASLDGRRVAFLAAGSSSDARYRTDHPGGPSHIVVLDLVRRRAEVVPRVELAPKSGVGLAWSPDGRYLVAAVNAGPRTRLLVWRPGWDRPGESPAQLPGRVQYAAPVLVAGG